jgi:hypothetical protein
MLPMNPAEQLTAQEKEELNRELDEPGSTNPYLQTGAKIIFSLLLFYILYQIAIQKAQFIIFLDPINIITHEGSHALVLPGEFLPFGKTFFLFVEVAAGSVGQVVAPLLIALYFYKKSRWFSSLFGLFWAGESLSMNHFYLADARCQCLPVTISLDPSGGGIHDWNYMLSHLGLLNWDQQLATLENGTGIVIMVIAVVLMILNIYKTLAEKLISR